MSTNKRNYKYFPKKVEIRIPQYLSVYGPGSIMPTINDDSVILSNPSYWASGDYPPQWKIQDVRLQKRLGVDHFKIPPVFFSKHSSTLMQGRTIRAFRFPKWHYCPRCGFMNKVSLTTEHANGNKNTNLFCNGSITNIQNICSKTKKTNPDRLPKLIPSRFIAVCKKGHIQDFPYRAWLHDYSVDDDDSSHRLKFEDQENISAIRVVCLDCKAFKTFQGVMTNGIGKENCEGSKPWQGANYDKCKETLKIMQQGASNAYFPITKSSIYLPKSQVEFSKHIDKIFKEHNQKFLDLAQNNSEDQITQQLNSYAMVFDVNVEDLKDAFYKKYVNLNSNNSEHLSEEEFRLQEYEAIINQEQDKDKNLIIKKVENSLFSEKFKKIFNNIYKIEKLREIRAFYGFTRIEPHDPESSSLSKDDRIQSVVEVDKNGERWSPGIEVRGEGIFFEFKETAIAEWEKEISNNELLSSMNRSIERYNSFRKNMGLENRDISYKFYLLHTFSHLIIKQLSYECGYSATELRERIYCNSNPNNPMNGVLIYTASGDSEGSYGGLIRQCEPFLLENNVQKAINASLWCSYDPLCIENDQQGTDGTNIAACYSCSLLPETSCEEGNRLLNRSLICGKIDNREISFFKDFID